MLRNLTAVKILNAKIIDDLEQKSEAKKREINAIILFINYQYDEIGNLIADKQEEIAKIEWMVAGKIKKIIRTSTSTKSDLEFKYDEKGNRVTKIEKTSWFFY